MLILLTAGVHCILRTFEGGATVDGNCRAKLKLMRGHALVTLSARTNCDKGECMLRYGIVQLLPYFPTSTNCDISRYIDSNGCKLSTNFPAQVREHCTQGHEQLENTNSGATGSLTDLNANTPRSNACSRHLDNAHACHRRRLVISMNLCGNNDFPTARRKYVHMLFDIKISRDRCSIGEGSR